MHIEDHALNHWIENFYGYGSWQAKCWFVAYEEGGGNTPDEVAEKFNYFMQAHPAPVSARGSLLCDIRDLYRHVTVAEDDRQADAFDNRFDYRFGPSAIQNSVWKNLIAFVHGYQGKTLPDLLAYQKQKFVSPSVASEALISLYPLPSPHNHAWYYSWLHLPNTDFLKSRARYEAHLYEQRINTLLTNLAANKPEVVLLYGMHNINTLKESVCAFFPGTKFTLVKAIKQQIPQHHLANVNDTILIITTQIPALRHNRIETGFDWAEFGKLVSGS
jgi:hypothetical protein